MNQLRATFDIVFLADFRVGDTGAGGAVETLRALAGAGYRVGVMPWIGAAAADPFELEDGLQDLLAGNVRRVSCTAMLSCRLLLGHDLRLFQYRAAQTLSVQATHRIVICQRGDLHAPGAARAAVANAEEALGGAVTLAPAAATIRARLLSLLPAALCTAADWPPVIAPDALRVSGTVRRATLPMLGYYRSAKSRAWPDSVEGLQRVLPDHPLLGVAVYGADERFAAQLARRSVPAFFHDPADGTIGNFLDNLDALTSNSEADDDPWPDEVLQALIHGVVPILPPEYRTMFQSAAAYCKPEKIADLVIELFTLPLLIDDIRRAGRELIDQTLAPQHLVARVGDLIGPPAPVAPVSRAALNCAMTVLSVSTNGIGMGHLARQMAIARRLDRNLTPVFLGFSQSIALVRDFGWISEYLPYHTGPAMSTEHWNHWLFDALDAACRFYRPGALVLDANVPFKAFEKLRAARQGLPMIWVRRAMWGPGRDLAALEMAPLFDTVIEPGERAAHYDSGPTTAARAGVRHVAPMHLVDRDEILPRARAAAELGIDPDTLNVLLMPGALNNFDARGLWSGISDELGRWQNTSVVAAEWAIAERPFEWPGFVARRKGFPYARWFNAFDFAVSAAGYNSFAELTGLGLPAIFVPNENPLMDRQDLRARYAERNGIGLHLAANDVHNVGPLLTRMRDPVFRNAVRTRLAATQAGNGAVEAAGIVSAWANSARSHRANVWL